MRLVELDRICPLCEREESSQTIVKSSFSWSSGDWSSLQEQKPAQIPIYYFAAVCLKCKGMLLYALENELPSGTPFEEDHPNYNAFPKAQLVWPVPPWMKLVPSLPKNIGSYYLKAMKSKKYDPDSFAVWMGKTLERICDHFKITKSIGAKRVGLHARLNILADQETLPKEFKSLISEIRELRNKGAHEEINPIHVPTMELLFNFLLDYLFILRPELDAYIKNKINA